MRNARGGNMPDLLQVASDIESFGAQGITIHPRPDERHIRYEDARKLKQTVGSEFNIEGNPTAEFLELVLQLRPTQVTLVPDAPDAVTSNAGWDTRVHQEFLRATVGRLKEAGIRTSIFLDPVPAMVEGAVKTGTDRIELYTEAYASAFAKGNREGVRPYREAALLAGEMGLGLNAGHDLNLQNIRFFKEEVPGLLEVSIGHALICEALYLGLEQVLKNYLNLLR